MVLERLLVRRVAAPGEQAAMDFGVQRLDPPIHHLREAGDVGDINYRDARFPEQLGGAAGRDDLDAARRKRSGELGEAGLVADGKQRAFDFPRCHWKGWSGPCSRSDCITHWLVMPGLEPGIQGNKLRAIGPWIAGSSPGDDVIL
jgi:hypothetical protein